jgi:hypothetical protein
LRRSARHALSLRWLTVRTWHGVGVLHLLREAVATTRASRNTRVVNRLLQSVLLATVVVAVRVEALRRHTVHVWLRVRLSGVVGCTLGVSKVLLLVHGGGCDGRAAVLAVG